MDVLFENEEDMRDAKKAIESMFFEVDCIESGTHKLRLFQVEPRN